jgi:hypothetical protein
LVEEEGHQGVVGDGRGGGSGADTMAQLRFGANGAQNGKRLSARATRLHEDHGMQVGWMSSTPEWSGHGEQARGDALLGVGEGDVTRTAPMATTDPSDLNRGARRRWSWVLEQLVDREAARANFPGEQAPTVGEQKEEKAQ